MLSLGRSRARPPPWVLIAAIGLSPTVGDPAVPAAGGGVCGRSLPVRTALVSASGVAHCEQVDRRRLGEIIRLDLRNQRITSIDAGDFDGLVRLRTLDLSHNLLAALPPGLFDGLHLLKTLRLDNNLLGTLPTDIFDELPDLVELSLNDNRFRSLPDGLFDEFSRFDGMQPNGHPSDNSGAYPRIQRFLDRHGVRSKEEFIAALPDGYHEHFVTVHASESEEKHHVSGDCPRIISFGGNGRLIFAWSTDPASPSRFRESVKFLRQNARVWTGGHQLFRGRVPARAAGVVPVLSRQSEQAPLVLVACRREGWWPLPRTLSPLGRRGRKPPLRQVADPSPRQREEAAGSDGLDRTAPGPQVRPAAWTASTTFA